MWNLNLLLAKIMFEEEKDIQIVGGLVGDGLNSFVDNFKKGFVEIVNWLITSIFSILSPFVIWGCKAGIVICVVIFYVSEDKRAISKGLKLFFVFLLFVMIRGAVL